MKIVYLHGLDSKLSPEKKEILQKFGEVIAPNMDYYNNENTIELVLNEIPEDVDVIIGSSMGGFAGYYISTALHKPALLFNPALKNRSVPQTIPNLIINKYTYKQFLLGAIDEVVNPGDTLNFIAENYNEFTDFHFHIQPGLTHNIPLDVFEFEVRKFLKNYKTEK